MEEQKLNSKISNHINACWFWGLILLGPCIVTVIDVIRLKELFMTDMLIGFSHLEKIVVFMRVIPLEYVAVILVTILLVLNKIITRHDCEGKDVFIWTLFCVSTYFTNEMLVQKFTEGIDQIYQYAIMQYYDAMNEIMPTLFTYGFCILFFIYARSTLKELNFKKIVIVILVMSVFSVLFYLFGNFFVGGFVETVNFEIVIKMFRIESLTVWIKYGSLLIFSNGIGKRRLRIKSALIVLIVYFVLKCIFLNVSINCGANYEFVPVADVAALLVMAMLSAFFMVETNFDS